MAGRESHSTFDSLKFCTNCTDKVRMDAGLYADDQFGRIIDEGARQQMINDLYK